MQKNYKEVLIKSLTESIYNKQGFVQILQIKKDVYIFPFINNRSISEQVIHVNDFEQIKKVGGQSPASAFGKWNTVPTLNKLVQYSTIIDQGNCVFNAIRSPVPKKNIHFKEFQDWKIFPSNAVLEFKTNSNQTLKKLLGPFSVFFKYKGTLTRIR